MGVIVCVTLLFGLLALLRDWRGKAKQKITTGPLGAIYTLAAMLSVAMGLWNTLWYGLRHLGSFWGNAALITGLAMLLAGFILLIEDKAQNSPRLSSLYKKVAPARLPVMVALLAGFLLYAVTLIQLNLGYAIIH